MAGKSGVDQAGKLIAERRAKKMGVKSQEESVNHNRDGSPLAAWFVVQPLVAGDCDATR